MAKSMILFALVCLWMVAGCAPASVAPAAALVEGFPEAAQAALIDQLDSPDMEITSATLAASPEALRRTTELWCVIARIPLGADNTINRPYIVFLTAADQWGVSISEADAFFDAGCANHAQLD